MISVITPVYKTEGYLDQCVKSILNQSYRDFEFILVDDGSPDRCGAMCDCWAEKDCRVKVIHCANNGVSAARNAGIDQAKGDYLCFVDSDDWVAEDYLETLYTLAKENEADMACCNFVPVSEDGSLSEKIVHTAPGVYSQDAFWSRYFSARYNRIFFEVAWNKLYRRKLFDHCRYQAGKFYEDSYILFDLVSACGKIAIMDAVKYFYRQHSDSIMSKARDSVSLDSLEPYFLRTEKFMKNKKWFFAENMLCIVIY